MAEENESYFLGSLKKNLSASLNEDVYDLPTPVYQESKSGSFSGSNETTVTVSHVSCRCVLKCLLLFCGSVIAVCIIAVASAALAISLSNSSSMGANGEHGRNANSSDNRLNQLELRLKEIQAIGDQHHEFHLLLITSLDAKLNTTVYSLTTQISLLQTLQMLKLA